MGRRATVLGISALGIAGAVFSLHVARAEPALSYAGASIPGAIALLGAGWALIGCGLAFWVQRRGRRLGPLLAAAGFAWFLLEWNNPGIGSALAFTVGLCLYAACPPIVAHGVLAYPGGRLRSHLERAALAAAYGGSVLVLGVLPALVFDPASQGCTACPRNLLLVIGRGDAFDDLNRVGVHGGLAWALALALLVIAKLVRASGAVRRAGWAVFVAGGAYLVLVAGAFAVSLDRDFLAPGTLDRRLWRGEAAALAAVALGAAWGLVRARHARTTVARLVVDLAGSPRPGGLREVLAGIVGDPQLVLAYPLDEDGRLVDAYGRRVELAGKVERTTLVRDGQPVAILGHAPGLLDDEQLADEVTAAARLALENERLQAEVRARLEELRRSRARIVESSDVERKRLERDLHDGAQQRLVTLSLSLRLLRSQLPAQSDAATAALEEAERELRGAVVELRELAHGIFPAVLADQGLAAAVRALAEEARVPIQIGALPGGRFGDSAETAAYTVVAEVAAAATGSVAVHAQRRDGNLVVEVATCDSGAPLDLVELEDRVGAVEGRLDVTRNPNGRVTILAAIPCGS